MQLIISKFVCEHNTENVVLLAQAWRVPIWLPSWKGVLRDVAKLGTRKEHPWKGSTLTMRVCLNMEYIYIWFVPQMATLVGMMLNHGFGSCPLNIQTNPLQLKGSWWPWVFHPGCDDSGSLLGCPSTKTWGTCGNHLGITWKMARSLLFMNDCNFVDLIWFAFVLLETQTDFNQDRVNLLVMWWCKDQFDSIIWLTCQLCATGRQTPCAVSTVLILLCFPFETQFFLKNPQTMRNAKVATIVGGLSCCSLGCQFPTNLTQEAALDLQIVLV